MDTEFEATYLDIDKDELKEKLQAVGASLKKAEFLQKRMVFDLPSGHEIKGGWLRVRDEAGKITLTLKVIDGDNIENQREVLLGIDNFEKADQLLQMIGCKRNAYQENRREVWELDGAEITIDEWPFLEPYTEIEGKSKEHVIEISNKLGFDFKDALFCSVDKIYSMKYNISTEEFNHMPEITFSDKNPFV